MCEELNRARTILLNEFQNVNNIKELNIERMEHLANVIREEFSIYNYPVNVKQLAERMGIQTLEVEFIKNQRNNNQNIGGALAVGQNLVGGIYKRDKVIKVNQNNSYGHQRFTIMHEIYHYIFDYYFPQNYNDSFFKQNEIHYNIFYENEQTNDNENEQKANRFAAAFLMPRNDFISSYAYYRDKLNITDQNEIIEKLSQKYLVSNAAIIKRFEELGINI